MGMYGQWLRVSPAELEHAKADLNWAYDLAEKTSDAERDSGLEVAARRSYDTDKTWHALDYLLHRRRFPVSIVYGEEPFVDSPDDPDADWGYGPPGYLTPERVRQAAVALSGFSEADLTGDVDIEDLRLDEIYPAVWDDSDALQWVVHRLPDVKAYFGAAAKAGDAVICRISSRWVDSRGT